MKRASVTSLKRIRTAMRRERAPKNTAHHANRPSSGKHLSENAIKLTRNSHSLHPIAMRLDAGLPQSESKGKSGASMSRKDCKTRRKSKTHQANQRP
jgi:hypothetical protein